MNVTSELKAMMLTTRLMVLSNESIRIGNIIGDLPVVMFPTQHEKLIELTEMEFELETQLYEIYIENGDTHRAEIMLEAQRDTEHCLFLLKEPQTPTWLMI